MSLKERNLLQFIQDYIDYIVISLVAIVLIQFFVVISLSSKLKKLSRSYKAMMGSTAVDNLQDVIIDIQNEIVRHQQAIEDTSDKVEALQQAFPLQKSKLAIHRYNAFADSGSDLSFSLAIMNDRKDGIVLTSIHSREGMYLYGKPVVAGQSNYSLTPEERKVIEEAK